MSETLSSKPGSTKQSDLKFEILKIKMTDLVPHEGILDWHLKEIFEWMERDGFQLRPIAVSRLDSLGGKWNGKYLIHDGHHRTAALKKLGCTQIMISVFDYNDPGIKVFDYNDVTIPVPKLRQSARSAEAPSPPARPVPAERPAPTLRKSCRQAPNN